MARASGIFKWIKRIFYLFILFFIFTNYVLYNHAYYFTHFVNKELPKVKSQDINKKSFGEKLKLGIWGVELPKQQNLTKPDSLYEEAFIGAHPRLHTWWIPTNKEARGIIILFHGYNSCKSSQLERSRVFRKLGYHTFLVDFRGHGDSEGLETSIGFYESEDVKTAFDYISTYHKLPVILMGTSMGAVSILKSMQDYQLKVEKLIIECPFGSLRDAVISRFENMNIPTFALPDILLFWGGIQCKMDCNLHSAVTYSKSITTPTLLIYGKKDPKVRLHETESVYEALSGEKKLEIIENAAHDQLMEDDPESWTKAVWGFLEV